MYCPSLLQYDSDGNSTVIVAIDPDQEDTPNSIVIFSTAGPNKDYLSIDTQYGDIGKWKESHVLVQYSLL